MFGFTTPALRSLASLPLQLQQTRSIVYKKAPNASLPGYILPKQSSKTSFYTKMLK
ncbi:hypothetical protein HDU98_004559, partial [Podochytrium sp. JEL0797]